MKGRVVKIVDNVAVGLLGAVAMYFAFKAVYNYGFNDGCDATLTANQII